MSRVGRRPIGIAQKVKANCVGGTLEVSGPLGTLAINVPAAVTVEVDDSAREIRVGRRDDTKHSRSLHGLVRALAADMVQGVTQGFQKKLEIVGVGYNAKVQGTQLVLSVGHSHPVNMEIPEGLKAQCPTATEIVISGADKQRVGQFAAEVRRVRPPEPYKGKGIRYSGEKVRRKQGKAFVSGPG